MVLVVAFGRGWIWFVGLAVADGKVWVHWRGWLGVSSRVDRVVLGCVGLDCVRPFWVGLGWDGLGCAWLGWVRLEWGGMSSVRIGWVGLGWIEIQCAVLGWVELSRVGMGCGWIGCVWWVEWVGLGRDVMGWGGSG